jgi:hypothetical protein
MEMELRRREREEQRVKKAEDIAKKVDSLEKDKNRTVEER